MFSIFKKKPQGTTATFKIDGMHCTSCSMNIDGELEDTKGIFSASTSYANAVTTVEFNDSELSVNDIKRTIEKLGYKATVS